MQYGSEWLGVFFKAYSNEPAAPAEAMETPAIATMTHALPAAKAEPDCPLQKQKLDRKSMITAPNITIQVEAPALETVSFDYPKLMEINQRQFSSDLRELVQEQMLLHEKNLNKVELHSEREKLRIAVREAQHQFQQAMRDLHQEKARASKAKALL
jgi:hypothetical protein